MKKDDICTVEFAKNYFNHYRFNSGGSNADNRRR